MTPAHEAGHDKTRRELDDGLLIDVLGIRRFTRLTNAFGKKLENQIHSFALDLTYANFCRIHKTVRMSPAMAAGVTNTLHDIDWIVELIEARTPPPGPRGPYRKRNEA